MKKYYFYALTGAIALAGAVGLSACSSSEDASEPNPLFDGEAVKTQFTIAFPQNVAKTRMSGAIVQQDETLGSFRGMDNILLYPFSVTGASGNPVSDTHTKLGDAIQLRKIISPNEVTLGEENLNSIPASTTTANSLNTTSNSVVYDDVSIPVGTGSFLFYGKAKDADGGEVVNGALAMSGDEPNDIMISPVQIYGDGTDLTSAVGTTLAEYLSAIAQAGGMTDETSAWEAAGTTNSGFKDLYEKFVSLKAGSSLTAQAAVQDLYTTLKNNTDNISVAIKTAILTKASVDTDGILTFDESIGDDEDNYFPGDIGLPDGAAFLDYDEDTNTFTQKLDGSTNTGANFTAKYADYVYPASLYYFSNSGVKTSTSSQKALYASSDAWSTITANEAFTGNSVSPSTRSVAIINPIQYAVGRLDSQVKCQANTLYDKNGDIYDASQGFTLTGILIGGQIRVNYDFTTSEEETPTIYTIYDNVTKSLGAIDFTNSYSTSNYTLALETKANTSVYVAVELLNKGADFQGADGVVPAGCKFYLVGELKPSSGTGYNSTTMNQVFRQDYNTIANFTIKPGLSNATEGFPSAGNTTGLGKAYNTIPDLRAPELELGLSVDLHWNQGIEFEVEF